jgi:tetratricopeptide (TPR) repeat protein
MVAAAVASVLMPGRRPERRGRRPGGPASRRPTGGRRTGPRAQRSERPLSAAQQRSREVAARRRPRPPRDPEAERQRIAERTLDVWIDEGAAEVRDEAAGAAARAATNRRRRQPRPLDPDVAAAVVTQVGDRRRGERLAQRLAEAEHALERDRLDDARRAIAPLLREAPGVAAVHEVAGLVNYRLGRWRDAVRQLEAAQALNPRVDLLPILADSYRALRRWSDVERIWTTVREISPEQEVLAEARIVAAGAQADRGDLSGALRTMAKVPVRPRRVREHHLRQWYVVADLHDRAGDPMEAARWFERIAVEDPDFVDVRSRLRDLGR